MIRSLALLAFALPLGCSKAQPPAAQQQPPAVEVKVEPLVAVTVAEGVQQARDAAGWIKQANDERERFQREQAAIADAGLTLVYYAADKAYSEIVAKYEASKDADWPAAAKAYVEAVEGKRLASFDPEPEKTATRLLDHAKKLAADGKQAAADEYFKRVAGDFPATAAGKEAAGR